MASSLATRLDVLIILCRLYFLFHLHSTAQAKWTAAFHSDAQAKWTVAFHPEFSTVNETSVDPVIGSQNVKRNGGSSAASAKLERTPRFVAVVASFVTDGKRKAKIESIENAGTESIVEREKLELEVLPNSRSSALVETDLERLKNQSDACVDVVQIQFSSRWETYVEKVRTPVRGDEVSDTSDSVWDWEGLIELCRWPYIAHVFSLNWLLAKGYILRTGKYPTDKFIREIKLTNTNLKCVKGCKEKLSKPNELVKEVKEKVKKLRDTTRGELRLLLQKRIVKSGKNATEILQLGKGKRKKVGNRKAMWRQGKEDGNTTFTGYELDADEAREFPLIFPFDRDPETNAWNLWDQWETAFEAEIKKKRLQERGLDTKDDHIRRKQLRRVFFQRLTTLGRSPLYSNCPRMYGPPT